MKNNTRCIPVAKSDKYPEGLIKFNICSSCPCFNSEWDECVLLNVAINFRDFFGSIHKDCPLPLYDRMRWHDAKRELPENFLNVAVKMLKDGKVVYGTGLTIKSGTWVADGIFIDGIVKIEILEWRYYE
ncbi:MAG TPA: hypothetical protein VMW50_13165 [Dehalococcoidia bacterium]|nr:hypothetical protein [Dehalococcoidia bacterium]